MLFDLPFGNPDHLRQLKRGQPGSCDQLHNALSGREFLLVAHDESYGIRVGNKSAESPESCLIKTFGSATILLLDCGLSLYLTGC
jgi:hypothetical protein